MQGPAQSCPVCDGTGWKSVGANGGPRRVVRCDCTLRTRGSRLLSSARIPRRYEHCDFESFDPEMLPEADASLGRAKLAAQSFVEHYPLEKRGLLFVGRSGLGKTHLAVSIMKTLIAGKGVSCLFCDYRELLKEIQNSYNSSVPVTELEVLRPVFNAEVLVIDDLGAVKPTEWVWDAVSFLLNTRYNANRATIVTTNFPDEPEVQWQETPKSFSASEQARAAMRRETLGDRITERMRSRLHEMCRTIQMHGQDFRLVKASHCASDDREKLRTVGRLSLGKSRPQSES
jgi:DNA replication protein DnaC